MRTSSLQALAGLLLFGAPVLAQGNGCPNPSQGPDVIVGDLPSISKFGTVGGITGYAVGTTSCNVGDTNLLWISSNNQHPVIAQNMYRVEDGRIEQIGQSWLKHGFTALQQNLCCGCISSGTGTALGVGCSDPYSASLNGSQTRLGPRFQVNAYTGFFNYPYAFQGQTGNATFKRLQVANTDLDPSLHGGADYFCEGHYVSPDDAAAGHQRNNASYRRMVVGSFSGGGYNLSTTSSTRREEPAIFAWKEVNPSVQLTSTEAPGDGNFWVGSNVIDLGGGSFRYEYAVHNICSDRSGGSFTVPVLPGSTVTDLFFNDVAYHSGEPWDGADWTATVGASSVSWATTPHAVNSDANALRWGTLYSFGFTVNASPVAGDATIGLFKPGGTGSITAAAQVPGDNCVAGISNYCVGNGNSFSAGGASMSSLGTTSIAANDLELVVFDAVPGQFGLFYYGAGTDNTPFGEGVRCVSANGVGTFRLNPPGVIDFFGSLFRLVDNTNPPSAPGTIVSGSTWYFQFWYRDPAGGPSGFNLSDGLEVSFCP